MSMRRPWGVFAVLLVLGGAGCGTTTEPQKPTASQARSCRLLSSVNAEQLAGVPRAFALTPGDGIDGCQYGFRGTNAYVVLTHPPIDPPARDARDTIRRDLKAQGARPIKGVGDYRAWERIDSTGILINWSRNDTLSALQVTSNTPDRAKTEAFARRLSKGY